jgi:hypothetical protein
MQSVGALKINTLCLSVNSVLLSGKTLEKNINFHVSGAYGTVHFSDSWKKQGDFIEDGYAVALGLDKKWVLSKRFDIGAGPHTFLLKTTKYTFTNFSINFWLDFYLFPQH